MSPVLLFENYQHFATTFAAAFFKSMPPEVAYEELHAAALEGIWQATLSWKPKKGCFLTHARWCARRCMIDWLRLAYRKKGRRPWDVSRLRPSVVVRKAREWEKEEMEMRRGFLGNRRDRGSQAIVDHRRSLLQEYVDREEAECVLVRYQEPLRGLLRDYFLNGLNQYEIAKKYGMWPSQVSRYLTEFIQRADLGRGGRTVA